ncbi:MAG: aminotransferase class I/II-fold pyridoxal phosphate-dependent enzyme [Cryomorphaceae bacterium]|nr:aminotransferase class I/II-fold pyridoxal phosphate-dependent enzyme [Cryomorphaceae bacterium]
MPHFQTPISTKLPRTGTSIFTVMSALATEHGALNLSQGFPEFDVPSELKELVVRAITDGKNQYAPMAGVLALREAVAAQFQKRNGIAYDPAEEITITAGATQAIFTAITALVKENDEVIVFTPAYDCYAPAIELAGGIPVFMRLTGPHYRVDWDEVRKLVTRKTRMIIINTPHNPTGSVLGLADLMELEKIAISSDIIVLSDEVYEHIVFDGEPHASCASRAGLANQSLIVGSFGKSIHATGWKTGYIAGPPSLMAEFRKVHQYNVFVANTPIQHGIADFMNENPDHFAQLSSFYQAKRDLFLQAMKGSRFTFKPAEGGYFQLLNYSNISEQEDVEIAKEWTVKYKIASIPVSVFYQQPLMDHSLRFCFAKNDDTLLAAAEILKSI